MSSRNAPTRSEPQTPRGVRRALSIEWKLPLLITAVLAAGLAAFLGASLLADRFPVPVDDLDGQAATFDRAGSFIKKASGPPAAPPAPN